MPVSLRYQHPDVIQHLAQQYCLGLMSYRTRLRMEQLITQSPTIAEAVMQWQKHLSKIVDTLDEQPAPPKIWHNLEKQLNLEQPTTKEPFFANLKTLLWPLFSGACALLLCLSIVWQWHHAATIEDSPSYLAVMHLAPAGKQQLVLSAYQGLKPGQSQLKLQWLQTPDKIPAANLTLWSIDRESGARTKLGQLAQLLGSAPLSKKHWLLIKNSAVLQLTQGNKIVYSGTCLQLKPWRENS